MTSPTLPFRDCVRFYDRDADLVSLLAEHIGPALRDGQDAFAIVRPSVAHALSIRLHRDWGSTPGMLTLIDARSTLDQILVEGWPNPAAFDRHVAAMVRMSATPGRSAVAFGEMVSLLWDEGKQDAAQRMEALWHERLTRAQATLLCAYPSTMFNSMESEPQPAARRETAAAIEATA